MLFSTYGPVLDANAVRAKGMRGQAHIVFRDIQTSTQAMRTLQGFDFFGKEMVRLEQFLSSHSSTDLFQKIVYGKGQSHVIAKLRGTFEMPSTASEAAATTDLQRSIFNAPPGSVPSKPVESTDSNLTVPEKSHGTKRPREEEEEGNEEGVAPMEEDEESDAPMEASSDED